MDKLTYLAKSNKTYLTFRKDAFKEYGTTRYGMDEYKPYEEKGAGDKILFLPRKNLFMKDTYMTSSHKLAKGLARYILKFPEVVQLKFSGHAVFVSFQVSPQIDTIIEGQETDDRERMRKV